MKIFVYENFQAEFLGKNIEERRKILIKISEFCLEFIKKLQEKCNEIEEKISDLKTLDYPLPKEIINHLNFIKSKIETLYCFILIEVRWVLVNVNRLFKSRLNVLSFIKKPRCEKWWYAYRYYFLRSVSG